MALVDQIPIGRMPIDYLREGTNSITNILQKARDAAFQQQQLAEQSRQFGIAHGDEETMKKIRQQELRQLERSNDPRTLANDLQVFMASMGQPMPGSQQSNAMPPSTNFQMPAGGQGLPPLSPPVGVGVMAMPQGAPPGSPAMPPLPGFGSAPMPNSSGAANQNPLSGNSPYDINKLAKNPWVRAFIKHNRGFDIGAETPEQKRAAEFANAKELEAVKFEEKQRLAAEEERKQKEIKDQEEQNREKLVRMKENQGLEKDINLMQQQLADVEKIEKIALNDPSAWGKPIFTDWMAKTSKNPNVGTVVAITPNLAAITEGKLSNRGNIVALNAALASKPGISDTQEIALAKTRALKATIQRQIADSLDLMKKNAPEKYKASQAGQEGGDPTSQNDPLGIR